MDQEPDLSLDAAAYFRHLRQSHVNPNEHQRWSFQFRADEVEPLQEFAQFLHDRLHEFFHFVVQESVIEHQHAGGVVEGPPMLRLEYVGVIDEPTLAGMHKRLKALAKEHGLRYEGVATYSEAPLDLDIFDSAMEL